MNGYVYISDKPLCSLEIAAPISDMAVILKNEVMYVSVYLYRYACFIYGPNLVVDYQFLFNYWLSPFIVFCRSVFYKCPSFHSHIPKPPNGVNMPGKVGELNCIFVTLTFIKTFFFFLILFFG